MITVFYSSKVNHVSCKHTIQRVVQNNHKKLCNIQQGFKNKKKKETESRYNTSTARRQHLRTCVSVISDEYSRQHEDEPVTSSSTIVIVNKPKPRLEAPSPGLAARLFGSSRGGRAAPHNATGSVPHGLPHSTMCPHVREPLHYADHRPDHLMKFSMIFSRLV